MIAGAPNVGKSVLLNRLLGYERAIVYDQPGTTRDVLRTTTAWDGWLFELTDTAGMRDATSDPIERAGIASAHQVIAEADFVLRVFDDADRDTWETMDSHVDAQNCLLVANKCDLIGDDVALPDGSRRVSAMMGNGVEELVADMLSRLTSPIEVGAPHPFLPRHQDLLQQAASHLANAMYLDCARSLREIWE